MVKVIGSVEVVGSWILLVSVTKPAASQASFAFPELITGDCPTIW